MTNKLDIYKASFISCYEEEYLLVKDEDKKYIDATMVGWFTSFQIHSIGEPVSMARLTSSIFSESAVVQFVINLTNRYIINISGDEELGYNNLIKIVTSWCGELSSIGSGYSIIPTDIPQDALRYLVGDIELITNLLKTNRFLIIPVMVQLTLPVVIVDKDKS